MVFTSFAFLFLFLPAFLAVYAAVPRRWRNLWLFLASVVFYGWEKPYWVLIMMVSVTLDWTYGRLMGPKEEGRPHRKLVLVMSMLTNLGLLSWFKYANLFVHTAESLTGSHFGWQDILLPAGISFYTFQSMSYTIDVYTGVVRPERSFLDFACFVTMFPQLIAGPIVRYRDVHVEVTAREHHPVLFGAGAACLMVGVVKKVLIADFMAPLADAGFALGTPGALAAWTGLLAYSLQIYFDFSGYSDIATGLALMLGFHFPRNFDSPYQSQSITEVWRRWHISLSSWLRDYLYIPLGGNRGSERRTYVNLMLTMLLGGLWHGANWPFVLWGAYQGAWLALERWHGRAALWVRLPALARMFATWLVFVWGWTMFRAPDSRHLVQLWGQLLGRGGIGEALRVRGDVVYYPVLLLALPIVFFAPNSGVLLRRFHPAVVVGWVLLFVLALMQMLASSHLPFLYFQF